MRRTIFTAGFVGLLGPAWALAEEASTNTGADGFSLFQVPFRCEAAPQIGCGSLAKPILLELERDPAIREAWLNGTGTVVAVEVGVTLTPEKTAALEDGIAKAFECRFFGSTKRQGFQAGTTHRRHQSRRAGESRRNGNRSASGGIC